METGTKILVVDDNDFIRIGVSKMLSRLGYVLYPSLEPW